VAPFDHNPFMAVGKFPTFTLALPQVLLLILACGEQFTSLIFLEHIAAIHLLQRYSKPIEGSHKLRVAFTEGVPSEDLSAKLGHID